MSVGHTGIRTCTIPKEVLRESSVQSNQHGTTPKVLFEFMRFAPEANNIIIMTLLLQKQVKKSHG